MKKRLFFLLFWLIHSFVFAQGANATLNFNQTNLQTNSDTFNCVGLYTYLSVSVSPADHPYQVTLLKDGQVFEQNTFLPDVLQIPEVFSLDSLIYAGNYELTIITSLNDTIEESFSFYNPEPLAFDYTTQSPVSCEEFGEIAIHSISGGYSPYNIGTINSSGIFDTSYASSLYQSSFLIDSVNPGFYSITLQDSLGCLLTLGTANPITINQANPLTITSVSQDDSLIVCVEGGLLPYNFVLNSSDTITTTDGCMAYALCPGNYNVYVFDAVTSTQCADSAEAIIPNLLGAINQETSTMIVESGGVRPFSYSWRLNGDLLDGFTDSVYTDGLCPGSYTCRILDRFGCLFSFDINIDELQSNMVDEVDCFEEDFSSLDASMSGGTPPYQYLWNTGEVTEIIENLSPQLYTLNVTDNNGCEFYDDIQVPALLDSCLFNAFSPNGDQINDTWFINNSFLFEDTKVIIYNRWGAKVYESEGYPVPWDGKNRNGNYVKEGVYFYAIVLKNGNEKLRGSLSVFY